MTATELKWNRDKETGVYTSECGRFTIRECTSTYSRHGKWVLTDTARMEANPQYGKHSERKPTLALCKSAAERYARGSY